MLTLRNTYCKFTFEDVEIEWVGKSRESRDVTDGLTVTADVAVMEEVRGELDFLLHNRVQVSIPLT